MMYPPVYFQTADKTQLQAFLQQHYFGVLISHNPDLLCSPLPFLFEWHEDNARAFCHLARNNPQLAQLEGCEVTILIQGPHVFVPASCYLQQPAVSTWNYAMAELTGIARLLDQQATLALVRRQEQHSAPAMLQAEGYQQKLLNAIVGVEICLHRLQGRFKLSQNKPVAEQRAVVQYLQQTEQPATVWQMMQAVNGIADGMP